MALSDPALNELADLFGISTEFWDWKGRYTAIEDGTVIGVLKALGVDAADPDKAMAAALEQREKPWRRVLPPCVVVEQDHTGWANVHVAHEHPAALVVRLEQGGTRQTYQVENWAPPREINGELIGEATFRLPHDLPIGYHTLMLTSDDRSAESTLIITPSFLGLPDSVGSGRIWGYAAQLYSVRSRDSWGIGDLTDLSDLAVWSGTQQHAGYVMVNPLHAAQPEPPMEPSPYLPSTRRYVNPIYIRPEAIPEFYELSVMDKRHIDKLRRKLNDRLEDTDRLMRDKCWRAKRKALRLVHKAGLRPARQMAFDHYRRNEGRHLRDFATWCALFAEYGPDWRLWDESLRRPTSPEVAVFRDQHLGEIEFVEWLQWVAQDQISHAQRAAKDAGMAVGIITDLAVGVSAASADTWMLADVYANGVSVGAPPDAYNQLGQEWGQPPWRPDRLADLAYAPFRAMVRNALAHAGGVRIDHILGMFRLWWIPEGATANHGCYVRYDHEALIGIIALEASRADAMVIGEDLGTVEPWVRSYLARRGILGTSVLWFEGDEDGNTVPPNQWREYCMASVTTHDLPPTSGYLAGDHVRLRHELGLTTEPLETELVIAEEEQQHWMNTLREMGIMAEAGVEVDDAEARVLSLYRFLTLTPSRVLNAALVDAVGDRRVQNQPGTVDEHPNWRVPLSGPDGQPILLEDIYAMDRPMRLSAVMNAFNRVPPAWGA